MSIAVLLQTFPVQSAYPGKNITRALNFIALVIYVLPWTVYLILGWWDIFIFNLRDFANDNKKRNNLSIGLSSLILSKLLGEKATVLW